MIDIEVIKEKIPPKRYRRYITLRDVERLPKELKVYVGRDGGLFYDVREYEKLRRLRARRRLKELRRKRGSNVVNLADKE